MESRTVALSHSVSDDQLRELVCDEFGGRWDDAPGLRQGVIERGSAIVYLSVEAIGGLDVGEVEEVQEQLGAPPKTLIVIRVGRARGSDGLAEFVASWLKERWNGALFADEW